MKNKTKLLLLSLFTLCVTFFTTAPASAFSLFPSEPSAVGGGADYREYIVNFYVFALPATALVAVVLIMIGGIIWITSAGDQGRIAKAKEFIINAIIGLVILSGIYVILGFINPALVILQPPTLKLDSFGACYNASNATCTLTVKKGCESPKQFREGENCDDSVANQLQQDQLYAEFCADPNNFEVPEPIRAQSTIQCHSPQNNLNSSGLSDYLAGEACRSTHEYSFEEAEFIQQAEIECQTRCKSPCTNRFEARDTGQAFCYCESPSDVQFNLRGSQGFNSNGIQDEAILEYLQSLQND